MALLVRNLSSPQLTSFQAQFDFLTPGADQLTWCTEDPLVRTSQLSSDLQDGAARPKFIFTTADFLSSPVRLFSLLALISLHGCTEDPLVYLRTSHRSPDLQTLVIKTSALYITHMVK
jgi:hypothetical protein